MSLDDLADLTPFLGSRERELYAKPFNIDWHGAAAAASDAASAAWIRGARVDQTTDGPPLAKLLDRLPSGYESAVLPDVGEVLRIIKTFPLKWDCLIKCEAESTPQLVASLPETKKRAERVIVDTVADWLQFLCPRDALVDLRRFATAIEFIGCSVEVHICSPWDPLLFTLPGQTIQDSARGVLVMPRRYA